MPSSPDRPSRDLESAADRAAAASARPKRDTRTVRGPSEHDDPRERPHAEPGLPHDLDESTSSQPQEPSERGVQAHADISRGLVDTDRQPVMERVYRRQKER
jgi:hypothetical protein